METKRKEETIESYLQQIKDRLAKSTPGPWRWGNGPSFVEWTLGDDSVIESGEVYGPSKHRAAGCLKLKDAMLIAHAPTDLSRLLEIVEIYREALERIAGRHDETMPYLTYYERTLEDGTDVPPTYEFAEQALQRAEEIVKERDNK